MDNLRYTWPLHFVLWVTNFLPDNVLFLRLRGKLASPFFKKCGKDLRLGRNITFYNSAKIELGEAVYIAYGNWINGEGGVVIEDEVLLGPYNVIVSSSHKLNGASFRYGVGDKKKVLIKSGSWITSHCTIVKGSILGKGSCLASQSVLIGESEDLCLYGGSPAVKIKYLEREVEE